MKNTQSIYPIPKSNPKLPDFPIFLIFLSFCFAASFSASEGQNSTPPIVSPKKGIVTGVPTKAPYGGNLIVKQGPSPSSQTLGHVSNGDEVAIEGQDGSFFKITAPLAGYVWSSYIQVTETGPPDQGAGSTPPLSIEEYFFNSRVSEKAKSFKGHDEGRDFFPPPDYSIIKFLQEKNLIPKSFKSSY